MHTPVRRYSTFRPNVPAGLICVRWGVMCDRRWYMHCTSWLVLTHELKCLVRERDNADPLREHETFHFGCRGKLAGGPFNIVY